MDKNEPPLDTSAGLESCCGKPQPFWLLDAERCSCVFQTPVLLFGFVRPERNPQGTERTGRRLLRRSAEDIQAREDGKTVEAASLDG